MRIINILVCAVIFNVVYAGDDGYHLLFNTSKARLIERSFNHVDSVISDDSQEKSIVRAALYSAVIPGSGQYYSGSIWKAILFAGIEVAGWTTYVIYKGKGNNQDDVMRQYAHQHWDEKKYWSWLYYNGGRDSYISELPEYKNLNYQTDENEILIDYNEDMVNSLRFLETALGHTHHLPETKTQQYYEMIYKYLTQFGNAWDDADFFKTYYGNTNNMTSHMMEYRDMRNDMNNFHDIASTAINVILINHVLSAVDAALTARGYNRKLHINLQVKNKWYFDEQVQMYGINLSW